jgi:hypothetical protein
MKPVINLYPDIGRKDAQLIVIKELTVADNTGQLSIADMLLDEIKCNLWPDGLISHNAYLGTQDSGVLLYAQWIDKEHHDRYERIQTATRPGNGGAQYTLYRSMVKSSNPNANRVVWS